MKPWSFDTVSKAIFLSILGLCSYLITELSYRSAVLALIMGVLGITIAHIGTRGTCQRIAKPPYARALAFILLPAGLVLLGAIQGKFVAATPAISEWIFLGCLYWSARGWNRESLLRGAKIALTVCLTWSLVWLGALHMGLVKAYFMNEMVVAFSLVGLMGLSVRTEREVLCAAIGGITVSLLLGVESGILAALAGWLVAMVRNTRTIVFLLIMAGFVLIFHFWASPRTFESRMFLWGNAIEAWSASPLVGRGGDWQFADLPGSPPGPHSHNLFVSSLTRWGLGGLAAWILILWGILKDWSGLDSSARFICVTFLAWSLVDEPFYWWGAAGFMVVGTARGAAGPVSAGGDRGEQRAE